MTTIERKFEEIDEMKAPTKFRAKTKEANPVWVYGFYYNNCDPGVNQSIIVSENKERMDADYHEVWGHTVGQFTGLLDKNGKEIFESDFICHYEYNTWDWRGVVKFSHGVFGAEWLRNVKSQSMVGSFGQKHNLRRLDDDLVMSLIVVGNIYDNPDLTGVEAKP